MRFSTGFVFLFCAAVATLIPAEARAGIVEISGGGTFSRSDYGTGNYDWSRRWGASLGYHFSEFSEIELGFQDVTDRTVISGFQDTTFHDKILSVNWVQALTGKGVAIQPYFKVGIGQLNREAAGTFTGAYGSSSSPPLIYDQVTGILGAGLKLYLTHTFGLRAEGTSYLTGAALGTWQDNFSVTFGVSIYL